MAETQKYDPSKTFVGTRLIRDEGASGVIIDENTGEWKSGKFLVELFDLKTGERLAGKEVSVTRAKYIALKEDFDPMSKEEVLKEYFPDVKLTEASQTDLQKEADRSSAESELRAAKARIAELEAEKQRREELEDQDYTNVKPVGSPEEDPSNPEQEFSNEEMIAKGASAVGSGKDDVQNPEQSAPNVPEDEFSKKGGNTDKESVTNTRETDVKPVGSEAKTNAEVEKTSNEEVEKTESVDETTTKKVDAKKK